MQEKTYKKMKELVQLYEQELINGERDNSESSYIISYNIDVNFKYNPKYGDDRICECGHSYYRHFDPYEKMEAVGCKYCGCQDFIEKENIIKVRSEKIDKILKR